MAVKIVNANISAISHYNVGSKYMNFELQLHISVKSNGYHDYRINQFYSKLSNMLGRGIKKLGYFYSK